MTIPNFLASKFDALHSRGGDDWRTSKDLEDIFYVINGAESVLKEIKAAPEKVQAFLASNFRILKGLSNFEELLDSNLSVEGMRRREIIERRIDSFTSF